VPQVTLGVTVHWARTVGGLRVTFAENT